MKLVQILPGILVSFPLSFLFIAMISVLRHTQLLKKILSSNVRVYALGDSDLRTLGPVFNISHTRS